MRLQALLNLLVASAACAAMLLMPMTASAEKWHDTFVFDACEQRTFVDLGAGDEKLFDRREHVVRAGTPVSLTVRYPRLFHFLSRARRGAGGSRGHSTSPRGG